MDHCLEWAFLLASKSTLVVQLLNLIMMSLTAQVKERPSINTMRARREEPPKNEKNVYDEKPILEDLNI